MLKIEKLPSKYVSSPSFFLFSLYILKGRLFFMGCYKFSNFSSKFLKVSSFGKEKKNPHILIPCSCLFFVVFFA
jgi:hypothetical protein